MLGSDYYLSMTSPTLLPPQSCLDKMLPSDFAICACILLINTCMALVSTCIACICMSVTAHCLRPHISTSFVCSSINSSRFRSRIWNSFCALTVDWISIFDVRHSDRASLDANSPLRPACNVEPKSRLCRGKPLTVPASNTA